MILSYNISISKSIRYYY